HHAMDSQIVAFFPRVLDDRGSTKVENLLSHIKLNQPVYLFFRIGDIVDLLIVQTIYILDVTEPVVDQSILLTTQRRRHATTTIVTGDDYMLHLQHVY